MTAELQPESQPQWIAVGKITRAHGVKGEVSILPLSSVETRFEPGARLVLDEDVERTLTVAASRPHQRRLLVRFREVADRTAAEELGGHYLFVTSASAPDLPEDEYWAFQLVGCRVDTEGGRPLGTLREVVHTEANDIWVARSEETEVLIPALKDVVSSVDVQGRLVVVREVPGLTVP